MTVFRVGMPVICVNAAGSGGLLIERQEYVIERSPASYEEFPGPFLGLVGVPNSITGTNGSGWFVSRFRPVAYPRQSAEHDAALFRPILEHATIDELKRRLDELAR